MRNFNQDSENTLLLLPFAIMMQLNEGIDVGIHTLYTLPSTIQLQLPSNVN